MLDEELEIGLRSIAVPIRDGNLNIVAAVNVSTTASTSVAESVERLLPSLLKCAHAIEADLRRRV